MSKFFFQGGMDKRQDYGGYGYKSKGAVKFGTEVSPIAIKVATASRKAEIETILTEHSLFADIEVDSEADEDLTELDALLNKPETVVLEKTPNRNDPCSCGSGKKYKKCCG